ncbi:MAG TPA: biotin-dependent carboxyltransferase family protein [Cyclobacteriaceae bacterium]|jgi:antagonist of KipI|nr:biotin-dependent carboxyltransferase family protein [Cyclobacteriaceae bacterium]
MSIEVIKAGLLSTVVAGERNGFRYLGIGPGGAMDSFAMRMSNYLVGNESDAAALEMNFPTPELFILEDQLISLTGQGFRIYINNNIFPSWRPILVKKDAIIKFEKVDTGSRIYLTVHGGWKAQQWLGSSTSHLISSIGGYSGRALQKGDILEANILLQGVDEIKALSWGISKKELDNVYLPASEIRIVQSVETDLLSPESKEKLLTSQLKISSQSNRMGFRLEGEKLFLSKPIELVSSPVDFGTIQLLPDGNLIILMADHQTTGGYPRIGSVIKSDLSKLAQLSANDKISFKLISLSEAENEILKRNKLLDELQSACLTQYKKYFKV